MQSGGRLDVEKPQIKHSSHTADPKIRAAHVYPAKRATSARLGPKCLLLSVENHTRYAPYCNVPAPYFLAADRSSFSRLQRDSRKERCRPLRLYPLPTHDGQSLGPYLAPLMGRSTAHQCDRPEYRRQGARHVYVGQYRRISYKAVLGASDSRLYLCL